MSQEVVEISDLTKDELFSILIYHGFIKDANDDNKFIKEEQINTGKAIINGREILKTDIVKLVIEYIGGTTISDNNKVVNGHQIKLVVSDNELEFIINNKSDLRDFLGINVGDEVKEKRTKIVEDIL